jgi:hypothetical protein
VTHVLRAVRRIHRQLRADSLDESPACDRLHVLILRRAQNLRLSASPTAWRHFNTCL